MVELHHLERDGLGCLWNLEQHILCFFLAWIENLTYIRTENPSGNVSLLHDVLSQKQRDSPWNPAEPTAARKYTWLSCIFVQPTALQSLPSPSPILASFRVWPTHSEASRSTYTLSLSLSLFKPHSLLLFKSTAKPAALCWVVTEKRSVRFKKIMYGSNDLHNMYQVWQKMWKQ